METWIWLFIIGVIITSIITWIYIFRVDPYKALWVFLKEYHSYLKSYSKFVCMILNPHVEPLLFKTSKDIIYGGFIIYHGKRHTFIKHMVFVPIDGDLTKFRQVIGRIENPIFMKHPETIIHFKVPIEHEETIDSLLQLGYNKERTNVSNYTIELVKSKIMN